MTKAGLCLPAGTSVVLGAKLSAEAVGVCKYVLSSALTYTRTLTHTYTLTQSHTQILTRTHTHSYLHMTHRITYALVHSTTFTRHSQNHTNTTQTWTCLNVNMCERVWMCESVWICEFHAHKIHRFAHFHTRSHMPTLSHTFTRSHVHTLSQVHTGSHTFTHTPYTHTYPLCGGYIKRMKVICYWR